MDLQKHDRARLPFPENEGGYEDQLVHRQEVKDGGYGDAKRRQDKETRYWRDFLDFC